MDVLLLAAILLVSMVLIPLGLPGIWLMVAAGLGYQLLVPGSVGLLTVIGTAVLATIAEVIEFTLAGRYARKYGGSRRAGWGAMIGGILGAFMGVPVPIVGPVIGAFIGAFVGAFALELTVRESQTGTATRVAWGAMVGRVVAAAMKMGFGVMIAAWILVDVWL
ncbi:MAG TPA: DUF456 domain-containing protein [Gemmatimonadaceae bacterium]|nr:DUF456 domain-containing protein [Gemmatimonadaceae bacterium]